MALPFIGVLALSAPTAILPRALCKEIEQLFPGSQPKEAVPGAEDSRHSAFMIEVDNHLLSLMIIDVPVPQGTFDRAAAQSLVWPDAAAALARHRAHIVIAPLAKDTGHPPHLLALSIALSMLKVAAGLVSIAPVIGLLWSPAETMASAVRLARLPKELQAPTMPTDIWIAALLIGEPPPSTRRLVGAVTRGLEDFVGRELELTSAADATPEQVLGTLYGIANYVMLQGPILHDGQTMGTDSRAQLRIATADRGPATGRPAWTVSPANQ